jgi:hypothetical protein
MGSVGVYCPLLGYAFRTRAQREGHSLAWVLWQLVRRYVERGLD